MFHCVHYPGDTSSFLQIRWLFIFIALFLKNLYSDAYIFSIESGVIWGVWQCGSQRKFTRPDYTHWSYFQLTVKVIHPKYSKHWPYTVAHTIDCVCSKILNHDLNHGLFISFFKLISCHIHWIVYVLVYINFIVEFFSAAQNGWFCLDT